MLYLFCAPSSIFLQHRPEVLHSSVIDIIYIRHETEHRPVSASPSLSHLCNHNTV